jgi:hypothetical protein
MGGVVGAENTWVVESDIECSGYQEREKPETDDGGKEEGDIFCTELLYYKLLLKWMGGKYEDHEDAN